MAGGQDEEADGKNGTVSKETGKDDQTNVAQQKGKDKQKDKRDEKEKSEKQKDKRDEKDKQKREGKSEKEQEVKESSQKPKDEGSRSAHLRGSRSADRRDKKEKKTKSASRSKSRDRKDDRKDPGKKAKSKSRSRSRDRKGDRKDHQGKKAKSKSRSKSRDRRDDRKDPQSKKGKSKSRSRSRNKRDDRKDPQSKKAKSKSRSRSRDRRDDRKDNRRRSRSRRSRSRKSRGRDRKDDGRDRRRSQSKRRSRSRKGGRDIRRRSSSKKKKSSSRRRSPSRRQRSSSRRKRSSSRRRRSPSRRRSFSRRRSLQKDKRDADDGRSAVAELAVPTVDNTSAAANAMPTSMTSGAGGDGDSARTLRKKSKWDEAPPDAPQLSQLLQPQIAGQAIEPKLPAAPKPPPGMDPDKRKVLTLEALQIRTLIGKGGETIKAIRADSGASITIDHQHADPEGTVTIVGDVPNVERTISDFLMSKGCPLRPLVPPPPVMPEADVNSDVSVPQELVGSLIGPGGVHLKDVRLQAGGAISISVLPPSMPGGLQFVRIAGDIQANRDMAASLIRGKVEALLADTSLPEISGPCRDVAALVVAQALLKGLPVASPRTRGTSPGGLLPAPPPPPQGGLPWQPLGTGPTAIAVGQPQMPMAPGVVAGQSTLPSALTPQAPILATTGIPAGAGVDWVAQAAAAAAAKLQVT